MTASIVSHLLELGPKPAASDFLLCVYFAVVLLAVRLVCEAAIIPVTRKALTGVRPKPDKLAAKVFDDAYTALGAGAMLVWAWDVMIEHNGNCTPISTRPCLAGWPNTVQQPPARIYWMAMLGFYLYELIGTAIQRGPALNSLMVFHHVVTSVLMIFSYFNGLLRLGLMATALLDLSNPILHAAKTLQHLGMLDSVKWALFNTFALTFLVARVIFPPFTMLRVTFVDARVLPRSGYLVCNAVTVTLYTLQLFWFHKIVQLAVRGEKAAPKETGHEGKEE